MCGARYAWQPRVVAELNDYQLEVVRLEGDLVWHGHAEAEAHVLLIEPRGVANTGRAGGERTAAHDVWI